MRQASAFVLVAFAACAAFSSPVPDPAAPVITPAPAPHRASVQKRDSCTFSGLDGAAEASKSQAECATIVLSDVTVPSGTTLDLSKLEDGTYVSFHTHLPGHLVILTSHSLYVLTSIGRLRGHNNMGLRGMDRPTTPNQGQRHHH